MKVLMLMFVLIISLYVGENNASGSFTIHGQRLKMDNLEIKDSVKILDSVSILYQNFIQVIIFGKIINGRSDLVTTIVLNAYDVDGILISSTVTDTIYSGSSIVLEYNQAIGRIGDYFDVLVKCDTVTKIESIWVFDGQSKDR